jgi:hypothetical protein
MYREAKSIDELTAELETQQAHNRLLAQTLAEREQRLTVGHHTAYGLKLVGQGLWWCAKFAFGVYVIAAALYLPASYVFGPGDGPFAWSIFVGFMARWWPYLAWTPFDGEQVAQQTIQQDKQKAFENVDP